MKPESRKAIKEMHKFDNHKDLEVVRCLDDEDHNYYLVHFSVRGYPMSSIDFVDGDYVDLFSCCQRHYEDEMISNWKYEQEELKSEQELAEVEDENEYVIQSDIPEYENNWNGIFEERFIDNVDVDRWIDDHEGEIIEH